MAKPTISPTQSIITEPQWGPVNFQPFATNTPTSWSAPNLPAGVTIHASTGRISGAAEIHGIFVIGLVATNGDGSSDPQEITIRITPASATLSAAGPEIDIDVVTGQWTVVGGEERKLFGKYGDDLMLYVRLKKNGLALDLDLEAFTFGLKQFDNSVLLKESSGFYKVGSGSDTYYVIHISLVGDLLKAALSEYEAEKDYGFKAPCEFEWKADNALHENVGPETTRATSLTGELHLAADIVQAA